MNRVLLVLFILAFTFSCKKVMIEAEVPDSFRISMLPVKTTGFNEFTVDGTLEIRSAGGDVEYGLLLGRSANLNMENAQKFSIGSTKNSVDFSYPFNNLDTGVVYYARAFAIRKNAIEYSANQLIGKLSPQIIHATEVLNFGRPFSVITNIKANTPIKLLLNNTEVKITQQGPEFLIAEVPEQLPPGTYKLSLMLKNFNVTYQKELILLEGTWVQIDGQEPDNASFPPKEHGFIKGDWLYRHHNISTIGSRGVLFHKYNYKTMEEIVLSPYDKVSWNYKSAIVQEGSKIHFIGGVRLGGTEYVHTKDHWVYDSDLDAWEKEQDFPGGGRMSAASMLVNNKIYLGLGNNAEIPASETPKHYTDLWCYDLTLKSWKKMADFPEEGRRFQAFFSIASKLYVTAGVAGSSVSPKTMETWCYDSSTDSWSRKADYPGKGEMSFVNFSIGNSGYVGFGEAVSYNSYFGKSIDNHFYKYDPSKDSWVEVSIPIRPVSGAWSGANGTAGFVGGGFDFDGGVNKSIFFFTP